eukprot:GHVR01077192.1.p1 GENE.GHVR01077192.1~~GHVR01077192.1.p1  ORF type:complete len:244 (+),score=78.50 GHVR01077192.1:121-852(+)
MLYHLGPDYPSGSQTERDLFGFISKRHVAPPSPDPLKNGFMSLNPKRKVPNCLQVSLQGPNIINTAVTQEDVWLPTKTKLGGPENKMGTTMQMSQEGIDTYQLWRNSPDSCLKKSGFFSPRDCMKGSVVEDFVFDPPARGLKVGIAKEDAMKDTMDHTQGVPMYAFVPGGNRKRKLYRLPAEEIKSTHKKLVETAPPTQIRHDGMGLTSTFDVYRLCGPTKGKRVDGPANNKFIMTHTHTHTH